MSYPQEVHLALKAEKDQKEKKRSKNNKEMGNFQKSQKESPQRAPSPVYWREVTEWFNNDQLNSYQIEDCWGTAGEFMMLSSNLRVFTKKKEKKLPDAQKTWNRIKFDPKLAEDEFIFGVKGAYWDLDEITYEVFANNEERTWNC